MEQKSRAQLFLEVSVLLTGFSEAELRATGMLQTYYSTTIQKSDTKDVGNFFGAFNNLLAAPQKPEAVIKAAIEKDFMPSSCYNGLAQSIILLWYTGNWSGAVISADSYIQGLMWDAVHAHPPGAKQPGYGSWANLPLTLKTLNNDANGN